MILHRKDVEKIMGVLEKFSEVETFELSEEGNNGIGTVLSMAFKQDVKGVTGCFEVEISGVENW